MKHYIALEFGGIAMLAALLLSVDGFGGPAAVVPWLVIGWMTLQIVSSIAFFKAIESGKVILCRVAVSSKALYSVAKGARFPWLALRHMWMYKLMAPVRRDPSLQVDGGEGDGQRRPGAHHENCTRRCGGLGIRF